MAVTLPTCLRRRKSVRVGLDLVEVADVAAALASPRAARYLDLVYTAGERRDCETPSGALDPSRLAARFAAKEAAWKALGDRAMALGWRSIEVEQRHVRGERRAGEGAKDRVGKRRRNLTRTDAVPLDLAVERPAGPAPTIATS